MTVTKEYRIVLPITVGEYQVAQLYSVAESSKVNHQFLLKIYGFWNDFLRMKPVVVKVSKSSKMNHILKAKMLKSIR